MGAARSSRWAPASRSTITPRPRNMVLIGMSKPIVPVATNASYASLVWSAVFSAGAMTSANRIGVSSGTSTSRGVCALSARRRRASVVKAVSERLLAGRVRRMTGTGGAMVTVDMVRPPRQRVVRRSGADRRRRASAFGM